MRPVRSIIVFNSATAGDFLMTICCSQIMESSVDYRQLDSGRMLINNAYFKTASQALFYNPGTAIEWDLSKMYPVENSHYWIPAYKELTSNCVYINYPHQIQESIMDIYVQKVFDNDLQKMLNLNLPNMIPEIRPKITVDNAKQVYNILWLKNLKSWSENHDLTAIELADFFCKQKFQNIVETLIGHNVIDQERFDTLYHTWINKNSVLQSLFA